MLKIVDRDGNVVSQSKNLRGIRDYVSNHAIKQIDVSKVGNGEGLLSILFQNGNSYQANFASYDVMTKHFLKNWHNVYGVWISVNGALICRLDYNTF